MTRLIQFQIYNSKPYRADLTRPVLVRADAIQAICAPEHEGPLGAHTVAWLVISPVAVYPLAESWEAAVEKWEDAVDGFDDEDEP